MLPKALFCLALAGLTGAAVREAGEGAEEGAEGRLGEVAAGAEEGCEGWEQLRVLGCAGDMGSWALGSLHPPLEGLAESCRRYADFHSCASVVERGCRRGMTGALEDLYDVLCNGTMPLQVAAVRPCWDAMATDQSFRNCQIQTALNGTADRCDAVQSYVDCARDHFWANCSSAVTILAHLFQEAQSECSSFAFRPPTTTTTEAPDPSRPNCTQDAAGSELCLCPDGFALDAAADRCEDVDECAEEGVCSQRCANAPGSFACRCDGAYELADDGRGCERSDNASLWIFFAHGQSIWNISADGKDFQLQRAALQKTAMIDVDVAERRLYYADIGANKLERMVLDGAFPDTLQSFDVEGTEGIAVDWVGRNLYSLRQKTMVVQALDGRFRRVLYSQLTSLPRALVLHPLIGYAYVTDWSGAAFVGRAAMDGSGWEKLVTDGVVWPNGLAIDYYADRIYWADAFLDTIESADLLGQGRRTVVAKSGSVPHVFGLAVLDDFLFWTDWTYRGILRAHKRDGANVTVLAQTALLPYGLKIFHPVSQPAPETNPCEALNCTQLCLLQPVVGNGMLGAECSCAGGWELEEDGRSCRANCSAAELLCGGSDPKCISRLHWCDGSVQCRDGADERACPERRCLPGQFQCHDGSKCLHSSSLCDGNPQCQDASDETFCPN